MRQCNKGVECAAGDAHRHPSEPCSVELKAAEAVEQAILAPGVVVARHRMLLGHEEILNRKAVAAGPLETDHMPDVGHFGARLWKQHRADDWASVRIEPRFPVALDHRDMATEPCGVVTAAGKAPARRDTITTLDDPRCAGSRTPGKDATR